MRIKRLVTTMFVSDSNVHVIIHTYDMVVYGANTVAFPCLLKQTYKIVS